MFLSLSRVLNGEGLVLHKSASIDHDVHCTSLNNPIQVSKLNNYCKLCSKTVSSVFTTVYMDLLWATHASYSDSAMSLCLVS